MNNSFYMNDDLFIIWVDLLIDNGYDWKEIGISDDYCNQISEPKYGIRLLNWPDKAFEVVDAHKYTTFLLRHR